MTLRKFKIWAELETTIRCDESAESLKQTSVFNVTAKDCSEAIRYGENAMRQIFGDDKIGRATRFQLDARLTD